MIANENNLNLEKACKIIFGPTFNYSNETLRYIQPSGVKKAFREKAKSFHPDMANIVGKSENELNKIFKEIQEAYDYLLNMVGNKNIKFDLNKNFKHKNYNDNFEYKDFYYNGRLPQKRLRFAEYLFFSKIITWRTLIHAIVWQNKKRPRIGQLFKSYKILTDRDIIYILKIANFKIKFGEAAIKTGLISRDQLNKALKKQSSFNQQIGKYFIENDIFTKEELHHYLSDHIMHNNLYNN